MSGLSNPSLSHSLDVPTHKITLSAELATSFASWILVSSEMSSPIVKERDPPPFDPTKSKVSRVNVCAEPNSTLYLIV
ncbi:hypothetical protein OGAPHI_001702 [Ogataea philodendri]|uniref:Uncharacterized protein n=1 Tax=Ogataea philodendri TaxID=1378263 RepID=A0A9P8P998_9ASCO|nr:uncharacterized protein OGAPHI_001702 [Ogataea philodendri]KAH3667948.1 hypothetical protein OGAPHI_001702 [Ogataea philodendri]